MNGTLLVVVVPVLIGSLAVAAIGLIKRGVMKGGGISPLQFLILWFAGGEMIFIAVYIGGWGLTWPSMLPGVWTAVLCGSAANVLIQFFSTKAASIDAGEVSFTAPLSAMTPGLISGAAILLREYPSRIGVAGIALMAVGSYLLLWDKPPGRWYEYLGPLKRLLLLAKLGQLSKEERGKAIVVALCLGQAGMGAVGLLFDGLYTRRSLSMQGLVLALTVLTALLLATYGVWYLFRPDTTRQFGELRWRSILLPLFVMGALWVMALCTIQPAYRHTLVAYVGTLKRMSILVTVVTGSFLFKEADFKKRLLATLLVIAGVILISMDDLPARLASHLEGLGL